MSPSFGFLTSTGRTATFQVIAKAVPKCACRCLRTWGTPLLRYLKMPAQVDHTDRISFVGSLHSDRSSRPTVCPACQAGPSASPVSGPGAGWLTCCATRRDGDAPQRRSLDQIGLVLRHRSIDVSAYYAKVDGLPCSGSAQPWPEVKS